MPFLMLAASLFGGDDAPSKPPLSTESQAELQKQFDRTIAETTAKIARDPKNVALYSARGDAYFFRGRFEKAVADYETMIALDPKREASHWRRGIAYFYAGRYKDAAHQFEIYHTFDDVDRENGIWRYLSQRKAFGRKKAREGLLKYEKDDREPFPALYRLFAGTTRAEDILQGIRTAKIDADAREARLFYAHLYIGLNHAVEGREKQALAHLREAVANRWAPQAGYGPKYMWHVARVHDDLLAQKRMTGKK